LDFIKLKSKSHDNIFYGFKYLPTKLQNYSHITKNIKYKQINKKKKKREKHAASYEWNLINLNLMLIMMPYTPKDVEALHKPSESNDQS